MSWDGDLARLKGLSLFVGTPMYSGQCHSQYAFGIARLAALCTQLQVALRFHFACNEPLITKARNATVDCFLAAGDGHLMFIDADIGFDPRDVLHLLGLQRFGGNCDVVAAPYPTRSIAWDAVLAAAKSGVADVDPAVLARHASRVAIDPVHLDAFPLDCPLAVTQAGTGFMMIGREVFTALRAAHPDRAYRPEGKGVEAGAQQTIHAYFDTRIEGGRYLSEDYAFCRDVRAAGMAVWLCPWMDLSHTGAHTFTSRLADLAAVGSA